MKKAMTSVPFHGTAEQLAALDAVIAEHKTQAGALMPVLQKAQDIYGYLPVEVQKIIAEKTGVSLEEVYGIATFYSQFKLNPDGQIAIAVCLGTACYVKGSGDVLDEISKQLGVAVGGISEDGRYSLAATRCIGACGLAPVLTVNGEVYGRMTKADVATVLAKYRD